MLLDASATIAYKCSSCGSFEFFNISLFKLLYRQQYSFVCRCGNTKVSIKKDREYVISLPCIGCGNEHQFSVARKALLANDIMVFHCPETGIQQCFIGKDDIVRKRIDSLEKEFDELISTFGYDDYFVNTQVMFDALNKIHDVAEQGDLYCECGCKDIELTLLSDQIHLNCRACSANRIIFAASNEDLKDLLMRTNLLLSGGYPTFTRKQKI